MDLELNGAAFAQGATESDLARGLDSFFSGSQDSFIILSHGQSFVQAAKNERRGFVLERQDGSTDAHFSCSKASLTQEEVRAAFRGFLVQGESRANELPWQRLVLDDEPTAQSTKPLTVRHMIIFLLVVAAFLVYSLVKTFA